MYTLKMEVIYIKTVVYHVRLSNDISKSIDEICQAKNQTPSIFLRNAIEKEVSNYYSPDFEINKIKKALTEVLSPSVERLAKINAKTSQMTTTQFFLNTKILSAILDDDDKLESYITIARKLGYEYLKTKNNDEFIAKGNNKMNKDIL